jgi:hypothetical protein
MSTHDLSVRKSVNDMSSRADSSISGPAHRPWRAQFIEGRYIDQRKLIEKLKSIHGTDSEGENNFRVEVTFPDEFVTRSDTNVLSSCN